jgi:hypothetical protein
MRIDSKPGDKVQFVGKVSQEQIRWGSHCNPKNILTPKQTYTVDHTEIHSSYTKVFLVEFPDKGFNSIWFCNVAEEK